MTQLNQMQRFLAWHASMRQATTGIMATCVRVGVGQVTLPVTLGSQMLRVSDRQGNTKVERTDRDLIFQADLFTFDLGNTISKPQDGDQWYLDVQDGSGLQRFDTTPYNREPAWRFSDPYRTIVRVHTKFISDAVDPNQPTGLTAEVVSTTIVLAWLPQSDATTFNVLRSTSSGQETLLAAGVAGLGFVDDSVVHSTTYFYTIEAVNFFGTSVESLEVSAEA